MVRRGQSILPSSQLLSIQLFQMELLVVPPHSESSRTRESNGICRLGGSGKLLVDGGKGRRSERTTKWRILPISALQMVSRLPKVQKNFSQSMNSDLLGYLSSKKGSLLILVMLLKSCQRGEKPNHQSNADLNEGL